MPIKHVTQYLEAYFDDQLSPEECQLIKKHLATCSACTRHFFDAQRVVTELGPVLKTALGQPTPPPALRQRVRHALTATYSPRQFSFPWAASGRVLNALGTLAIIVLLAFGVFVVIRGQLPGADISTQIHPLRPSDGGGGISAVTNTLSSTTQPEAITTPTLKPSSLSDTLPRPTPLSTNAMNENIPVTPLPPSTNKAVEKENLPRPEAEENNPPPITEPKLPGGLIAFSLFNPALDRQFYEIHLINPDGANHRLFPLNGVSEPALRWTGAGHQMAYRAWSEPTSPRSLLSSNLEGYIPHHIGGFWEDAQPDWSPTENRIIFASQREMDRRWRLYTIWGDGSAEVNLRREGKSPTFAPDGYRFAFESCDSANDHCGLWLGDLENSEYDSYVFLEDPLARSPDWSPVGEQIAYMANPNDNWDLYLVNSDGSNVRRLTSDPAIEGLPAWSPDGEWLAFLSDQGEIWGIWLLHVKSGQVHQVISLEEATFTPPDRPPYDQRDWWDEQLSWSR
jgi:predicted anti-sigma-YlaC factor YlaD